MPPICFFAGSPISDLNPIWMACGAVFTVASAEGGERAIPAQNFFLGYRQVDLKPHEILKSVEIPFSEPLEFVVPFKQSPRREDDIAIVNACIRARLATKADSQWRFEDAAIGAHACTAYQAYIAAYQMQPRWLARTA